MILYQGPSMIDGKPIVVIAVGFKNASRNAKTGKMIQTYIIRSDIDPITANRTNEDVSICGDCVHRGNMGENRSCYVTLMHGPHVVYKSFIRGIYSTVNIDSIPELFADKVVRLGTYGDPAAVPFAIWEKVLSKAKGWTGYTHQWKNIDKYWNRFVMASADSITDSIAAMEKGYRTFRVSANGEPMKGMEVICPASEAMGKKTDCLSCRACQGISSKAKVSVVIAAHGTGKKYITA